jgi:hypothetical protein
VVIGCEIESTFVFSVGERAPAGEVDSLFVLLLKSASERRTQKGIK